MSRSDNDKSLRLSSPLSLPSAASHSSKDTKARIGLNLRKKRKEPINMKRVSTVLLKVLLSASLVLFSSALSASPVATRSSVLDGLQSTPLLRASDGQAVVLPSLWRANTPFGIGDETAVCAFLRHYG